MKIGITERGDPSLVDSAFLQARLQEKANIIVTKNITPLHDFLLFNQKRIILHHTITGYGGSIVEPKVKSSTDQFDSLYNLIHKGFPVNQIVGRVDPIFPSEEGIKIGLDMIYRFIGLDIRRIRYSFVNAYKHVRERFDAKNCDLLANCNNDLKETFYEALQKIELSTFESCCNNDQYGRGCISFTDLNTLGVKYELTGAANTRYACKCPSEKHELLVDNKRCGHKCLYCYMYD
ncbi:MAG: DUF1848 domain-containing protein [Deferribacteraceae bacterium]|jgi:DNA repair photolyase|nr:DUF1848 domain-containing protein [Deferribacteraceae bacterium]